MRTQLRKGEEWRSRAACVGMSHQTYVPFFNEGRGQATVNQIATAKRVCASCPVAVECDRYAVDNGIRFGIWGGRTPRDRGFRDGKGFERYPDDEVVGITRPEYVRPLPIQPEFDLYDFTFTPAEMAATAAFRKRRTEILAALDIELALLDEEEDT